MRENVNRKAKRPTYSKKPKGIGMTLAYVEPLTDTQSRAFDSDKHMVLYGSAGTGKTFISMYRAFEAAIRGEYTRVVIIRSNVETRKMGYLPGTEKEKVEVYESAYKDIASELFERGDAYDILKLNGHLTFMPTSFIRGTTLRDAYIIVDECQNMTYHELDSVITRVGQNSKIVFCGDYFQSDLKDTGVLPFLDVLKAMDQFDFINFTTDDIVRSEFVKDYLVTKYKVNGNRQIL